MVVAGATYTTVATGGNWSVNLATAVPVDGSLALNVNGTNSVSATATDPAGKPKKSGGSQGGPWHQHAGNPVTQSSPCGKDRRP